MSTFYDEYAESQTLQEGLFQCCNNEEIKTFCAVLKIYRTLTHFWPPLTPFLAPLNQGRLLVYGRNGQSICLLSPFFCPSSKIAQPKYAKGASERARSASVYGTFDRRENFDDVAWPSRLCISVLFAIVLTICME